MKFKYFILLLAISILAATAISNVCAYTTLYPPSAITGRGDVSFKPGALLDDFNSGSILNLWNAVTGTFSKPGTTASCTATYTDNPAIVYEGKSLQLDYNVNDTNSYAGYSSILRGPSGGTSLTAYTAVSFYVRGAVGGELFKVQLKNSSTTLYPFGATSYYRNTAAVYVTDYSDGGVSTGWKKVTIPFDNFANLDGLNSMIELDIVFENPQSVANGSPTQGTVYIDNITFETSTINAARIAHFGEVVYVDSATGNKTGVCALGGNMGTANGSGGTISFTLTNATNEYSPSPYGLRMNYNVTSADAWAATYLIFGGGQDIDPNPATNKSGWIAIPHDFSSYKYIYIVARGLSDTQNPKEIRVELADNTGAKALRLISVTTGFQFWRIPLTDFTGLDRSTIKQITFVLEGYRIGAAGGNRTGSVIIDAVQFEK